MQRRLTVSVLAVAAALTAAPNAFATIDGPCTASIAGQPVASRGVDARSEAIKVAEDARIPVTMSSVRPITHLTVELEFGGIGWTVHDETTEGTSWAKTVNVEDYASYGVGLYKVVGMSSGQGFSCTGAALVEVDGSPLSTIAGLAGIVMAAVGGLGLLWLGLRGGRSGGAPVLGAILGILLGAGVALLLQQFAIVYPTMVVAIIALGGGAVLGILSGLSAQRGAQRY
jgi:hypothetical protein